VELRYPAHRGHEKKRSLSEGIKLGRELSPRIPALLPNPCNYLPRSLVWAQRELVWGERELVLAQRERLRAPCEQI
jgi:hypothetical protein